jgi:uncharacterized MAPEG superfamily protein
MQRTLMENSREMIFARIVQAPVLASCHLLSMNPRVLLVYAAAVFVLWLKVFLTISLQARERHRARNYRYPEDASQWHGAVAEDSNLAIRAQNLLRNDAETQPFFYVSGIVYVLANAWPVGAYALFPLYVASRLAHAFLLLTGKQPARTYVFGAGALILTLIALGGLVELSR